MAGGQSIRGAQVDGLSDRVCVHCGKVVRHDRERFCNHCGLPFRDEHATALSPPSLDTTIQASKDAKPRRSFGTGVLVGWIGSTASMGLMLVAVSLNLVPPGSGQAGTLVLLAVLGVGMFLVGMGTAFVDGSLAGLLIGAAVSPFVGVLVWAVIAQPSAGSEGMAWGGYLVAFFLAPAVVGLALGPGAVGFWLEGALERHSDTRAGEPRR